jgi:hypothetical protein
VALDLYDRETCRECGVEKPHHGHKAEPAFRLREMRSFEHSQNGSSSSQNEVETIGGVQKRVASPKPWFKPTASSSRNGTRRRLKRKGVQDSKESVGEKGSSG